MARLAVFFVLVVAGAAQAAGGPTERPNIVFILTDDQRSDCMGCAGHPYLQTPNLLDKLEKEVGERAPPNTIPDTGNKRMGKSRTVPDR